MLPDPAQYAKQGSEHAHQVALFMWAAQVASKYPELEMMHAIPNGGMRDKMTAAKLKAEGVKASIPDVFLPTARGTFHGLYIELKRPASDGKPEGKATKEQLETHARLRAQGYGVVLCVGWEAARDMIVSYLEWQ